MSPPPNGLGRWGEAIGDEGCAGDGAVGLDGDGRAGAEYDREPRLPPLPARAQASVTGMAMDEASRTTTPSAMGRIFMERDLRPDCSRPDVLPPNFRVTEGATDFLVAPS
jgi:hypothetical protein